MKVLFNAIKGFQTVKAAARLILLLYLANLAFAVILAVPVHHSLTASLGASEAGDRMARGFDYLWWGEFREKAHGLAASFDPSILGRGALLNNLEGLLEWRFVGLPAVLLLALLVYILLHTFLAGGVLTLYREPKPRFEPGAFLQGAVARFPAFIGLTVLSWIFFFAAGSALNGRLRGFVGHSSRAALTERTGFWAGLAVSLFIWALIGLIQMVFDYARVSNVLGERRGVLRSFIEGLGFVVRHPAAAAGLGLLFFGAGLVWSVVYVLARESIGTSSPGGVAAVFGLQQVFIAGLVALRCWAYAGELHLARYFQR